VQHWDSYWNKTKTLNSFAEGEQGQGYQGEVAQFWQQVFNQQDKNACVLDLATGNGGLAVLALQNCPTFEVYAADLANIAPLQLFDKSDAVYPLLEKIHFYGNMAAEQLSFSDAQFNLVVSQFGFEYAEPEPTLAHIYRVLQPGGAFVALIHHHNSFITQDCQAGLVALQVFLATAGLLDGAEDFAAYCQSLPPQSQLSESQLLEVKKQSSTLLNRFKHQQLEFSGAEQEWFNLLARDVVPILAQWQTLSCDAVERLRQNMTEFQQRLSDQVTAAWSQHNVEWCQRLCQRSWQQVAVTSLDTADGTLCWAVRLTK
jgi:ubiquinone/menaquinone biosynthesis C-methylase UbiE